MKKNRTFTTCQALSKASAEAAHYLQKGEDIRKLYPIEGTGCGGRWDEVKILIEIDNAETGERIRDIVLAIYKEYDSVKKRDHLRAVKW